VRIVKGVSIVTERETYVAKDASNAEPEETFSTHSHSHSIKQDTGNIKIITNSVIWLVNFTCIAVCNLELYTSETIRATPSRLCGLVLRVPSCSSRVPGSK
jgi:hypothetical protein